MVVHGIPSRGKQTRSGIKAVWILENRRRIGRMRCWDLRMRLGHPKISKQPYDMPTYLRSQFNRGFCNVDIEIPIDLSTAVVCADRPKAAPSIKVRKRTRLNSSH